MIGLRSLSRLWLSASGLVFLLFLLFWKHEAIIGSKGLFPGPKTQTPDGRPDSAHTGPDAPQPVYEPGVPKPPGENYTRTLVIASTSDEDTSWLSNLAAEPGLTTAVYVVDRKNATYSVPANKGHEAMVYLTYIIDHYDKLADVTMFMHAHRVTWHNNDLMFSDAVETVQRLSSPKVTRDGYMNMRCHLDPGCPDHIHPATDDDHGGNVPEAVVIGRAWLELFPDAKKPPAVLSQPCCAQIAVSRARIRNLPRDRYIFFRVWLLNSELEDKLTGRVWEYVYQYIFGGVYEFCPLESICYCDGYGICFGGEEPYQQYFSIRKQSRALIQKMKDLGRGNETHEQRQQLQASITEMEKEMEKMKREAYRRGADPKARALEAGREWKEGDGF